MKKNQQSKNSHEQMIEIVDRRRMDIYRFMEYFWKDLHDMFVRWVEREKRMEFHSLWPSKMWCVKVEKRLIDDLWDCVYDMAVHMWNVI